MDDIDMTSVARVVALRSFGLEHLTCHSVMTWLHHRTLLNDILQYHRWIEMNKKVKGRIEGLSYRLRAFGVGQACSVFDHMILYFFNLSTM